MKNSLSVHINSKPASYQPKRKPKPIRKPKPKRKPKPIKGTPSLLKGSLQVPEKSLCEIWLFPLVGGSFCECPYNKSPSLY